MDKGKKDPSTFFFAILFKGGYQMARPYKRKFTMRSPEEKEAIVLEAIENGPNKTFKKHDINKQLLQRWVRKYLENGIDGLKSKTGKGKHLGKGNHLAGLSRKKAKTKEEELQLKVMKLEIEVARLKKGYQVKGVGSKKEYVTIKDLNTKS